MRKSNKKKRRVHEVNKGRLQKLERVPWGVVATLAKLIWMAIQVVWDHDHHH